MKNIKLNKEVLKVKWTKIKPDVMLIGGIGCIIGGTVLACKQTTKADAIVEDHKKRRENFEKAAAMTTEEEYTDDEMKNDIVINYAKTAGQFVKLYAPAVILETVGIALVINSHNEMKSRNAALVASYEALQHSYRAYQKRVAEAVGEEKEKDIRYGVTRENIEATETDENGEEHTKKVKKAAIAVEDGMPSPYAKFFDQSCGSVWCDNPEYNRIWLEAKEAEFTDKLIAQGYLFLNEVYRTLGLPETQIGQTHGWIYDPDDPTRDNYVSFQMCNAYSKTNREFINGFNNVVLIDPNVDGYILDQM